jgi:hypothetical protein
MRRNRLAAELTRSFAAAACLTTLALAGCGDESRTTGTMLRLSPEAKETQNDLKEAMREQRKERQAERLKGRGKRGASKGPAASRAAGKTPP